MAFIVQRYGREILGGAETLTRQIAERLARRHDIEVLTTTARDYITWRNEYPVGEEKLRGVRIHRFKVEVERNLEEFNRFSDWIYNNPHTREDELRWLEMQGPVVPDLIDYLRRENSRYDLLVFFTYLYYPTFFGLQIDPQRSVLVPTAHDEPPIELGIYKEMFELPSSFIFNTEAEELLVLKRFGVHKKMRETIGMGMELLDTPETTSFKRRHKLPGRYLLYAGRIDAGKGCEELIRFFRFYKEDRPEFGNLQLILIGNLSMRLPQVKDIRYLGFLDEADKLAAMAGATAVVIPSRLESLSIVALEAFSVGTPVLVNAGSKVLVDHCLKANAGLYYTDCDEFVQILDLLLTERALPRGLGRNGQRYIKENFGWEKLLAKYELAFRSSARPPRPVYRVPSEEAAPESGSEDEGPPEDESVSESIEDDAPFPGEDSLAPGGAPSGDSDSGRDEDTSTEETSTSPESGEQEQPIPVQAVEAASPEEGRPDGGSLPSDPHRDAEDSTKLPNQARPEARHSTGEPSAEAETETQTGEAAHEQTSSEREHPEDGAYPGGTPDQEEDKGNP